jgi:hypothetical protein
MFGAFGEESAEFLIDPFRIFIVQNILLLLLDKHQSPSLHHRLLRRLHALQYLLGLRDL